MEEVYYVVFAVILLPPTSLPLPLFFPSLPPFSSLSLSLSLLAPVSVFVLIFKPSPKRQVT